MTVASKRPPVKEGETRMARHITVAAAARLLGVGRRQLQQLIQRGELETFEGMLDMDAIAARFPQLAVVPDPVLERLGDIRATAFSRRVRDTVTPDRASLENQLRRRNTELSVERARANRMERILNDLASRLGQLQLSEDPACRQVAAEVGHWLRARLDDAAES